MARSKKHDSDIDSDTDSVELDGIDFSKPTTEDVFNGLNDGAILKPRSRSKPTRLDATPPPQLPPTTKKKKTKIKKKHAPLVNSTSTNNNNSKTKKRTRTTSSSTAKSKSSNALIAPAPLPLSSVAPHSSLATNVQHAQPTMPSGAPILQNDELLSLSGPNGALLS